MRPSPFTPALLGSFILLLFASLIGLILAGRPNAVIWGHSDVKTIRAGISSEPDWRTVVLFSERETLLSAEKLQDRIADIAAWASWSRSDLTLSEEVQVGDRSMIHLRMKFLLGLCAFDYTAPILERAASRLVWGRVLPGATTLFAWQLIPAANGRTRVSLTIYLDAPAYGALRTILESEGQAEIDRIVTHLLTAAR